MGPILLSKGVELCGILPQIALLPGSGDTFGSWMRIKVRKQNQKVKRQDVRDGNVDPGHVTDDRQFLRLPERHT
jgi:hypothetical protein